MRRALLLLAVLFVALVYLFLYAPLIVTAIFSLNDSTVQTLPLASWTLDWYRALFNDPQMIGAFLYSLRVALVSVLIASIAGLFFALVQVRMKFRGKKFLDFLLASPMVTPGMVLGISLLVVFNYAKIPTGFMTIVIGHAAFITPLIAFLVQQRLKVADPSLEQASMDCGAGVIRTFWHVTLPGVRVALIAGALLGFTLSMDEIAVTFFLAGTEPTLPVYVWGLVRFGFTPQVNAVFTLIAGGSLLLIGIAGLLLWANARRTRIRAGAAPSDPDDLLLAFNTPSSTSSAPEEDPSEGPSLAGANQGSR
ncbi:ABC transporter permease [Janibacter melonis]|uniref:ABC transporter permease n=1 Tax=Janibacter melonis TaxID=262209 RepID=UPI00174B2975|nr:ABC transporter permease [Janibacter melonis]